LKKNKISKNWLVKKHRDPFFRRAKIEGYRSRSSFKLIEMNKKFKFLNKNSCLLDLGSAPGGWSQVARENITKGKILSVDIKYMDKIKDIKFLEGDFMNNEVKSKIFNFFGKKIDVVISDMAINTSGNKDLDTYRTGELSLGAMDLALEILQKDGIFLSKIFMGSIFEEINKKAIKHFRKVVKYKPLSSKKESREIYIFCKGISKIF
jgi:23S rRNA (uridine2552-2'-O)-methyltransferase